MLDLTFVRLIESGLIAFSVPGEAGRRAPAETGELIAHLEVALPGLASGLVADVVQKLWQSCTTVGLPSELTEAYVRHLGDDFERLFLAKAEIDAFLQGETTTKLRSGPVGDVVDRIQSMRREDDPLDEQILEFVALSFVRPLHEARAVVDTLRPAIAGYIERIGANELELSLAADGDDVNADPPLEPVPPLEPDDVSEIPPAYFDADDDLEDIFADTEEPQETEPETEPADAHAGDGVPSLAELAERHDVSVELLGTLINCLERRYPGRKHETETIVRVVRDALDLQMKLERLRISNGLDASFLSEAARQLQIGQFVAADRQLANAEDLSVRAAQSQLDAAREMLARACEIRTCRAAIQCLSQEPVRAARHYAFARRYASRHDGREHWRLVKNEIEQYEAAATWIKDFRRLQDAAQACGSALSVMVEKGEVRPRAEAQLALARLLIAVGEQEMVPERCDLAIQLLGDAVSAFASAKTRVSYLTGLLLQADAFALLGSWRADPALVERAVLAYQSLQHELEQTLDETDQAEHGQVRLDKDEVGSRLALAMLDLGILTGNADLASGACEILDDAARELRQDWDHLSIRDRSLGARVFQGLARWYGGATSLDGLRAPPQGTDAEVADRYYRLAEAGFAAAGCINQSLAVSDARAGLSRDGSRRAVEPSAA